MAIVCTLAVCCPAVVFATPPEIPDLGVDPAAFTTQISTKVGPAVLAGLMLFGALFAVGMLIRSLKRARAA